MSKKACKKKGFEDKENAKYECKKCGARVNKEEKICKSKKRNREQPVYHSEKLMK